MTSPQSNAPIHRAVAAARSAGPTALAAGVANGTIPPELLTASERRSIGSHPR